MNKSTNRLRSLLFWSAAAMVSGPVLASANAQSTQTEVGTAIVAESSESHPMSDKADMKEVILNVFGMT